ncbi:MAG: hypothetical protein JO322_13005 [Candidatus Eremiobacteraeota bacterium]|nr:hypothetical protein [Candidatus Eremiobacteraeota bacterium]
MQLASQIGIAGGKGIAGEKPRRGMEIAVVKLAKVLGDERDLFEFAATRRDGVRDVGEPPHLLGQVDAI